MGRKIDPEDFIGQKFGHLTVDKYVGVINRRSRYECTCDCGRKIIVSRNDLQTGNSKTCGDCTHIEREEDYYRYYCHNGESFIFSPEDYEFISAHRWHNNSQGYAVCTMPDRKSLRLARALMGISDDEHCVDHINGNPRDNRRENLRVVTYAENNRNSSLRGHNKSGYKGVFLAKTKKKYEAAINLGNGRSEYLGRFDTKEEAAMAFDAAARERDSDCLCVNFPREGERGCREAV